MHVDYHGQVCNFADLPPGAAFRFGLRGEVYIGIKTFRMAGGQDRVFGCAVLAPGHPHVRPPGRPGVYEARVVEGYPVFWMPSLRLVVSQDRADWHMGAGIDEDPGHILITSTRSMIVAASGHGQVRVDIGTGETIAPDGELPILVKRWSLVLMQFEEPEKLFEFQP